MLFRLIMPFKYLIIILVAFAACTVDSRHRQLAMADAVMESAPDSAMTILADVDTAALSQSDYAYYCLLYTQGQIKTWTVLQSDSLFHVAYDAFRDHSDSDLRRRAYFYNAQIEFNRGDLQPAMRDVLTAYEIAKAEHNDYWLAKSAEMIGDIFTRTYNYPQSEKYRLEAVRYYKSAGRENSHRYALCDLALNYHNQNMYDKGGALLDSLRTVLEDSTPIDTALLAYLYDVDVPFLYREGRYNEIRQAYDLYLNEFYGDVDGSYNNIYLSNIEGETGDIEQASQRMALAFKLAKDEQESGAAFYGYYCQAKSCEDYKLATSLCDTLLWFQSRIIERIADESVTVVQRDFYNQKAQIEKKKSKFYFLLVLVSMVIVTIIVIMAVVIYRLKLRSKNEEIANQVSAFMDFKDSLDMIKSENLRLNEELSNSSNTLSALQQQLADKYKDENKYTLMVEQLFKDKWNTFNNLCNDYFEFLESDKNPNRIIKDIENELKEIRNPKNLFEIEKSVDEYLGGVMTLLRMEVPTLKEDDVVFLSLVFAGFSVRAVCLIIGIKYKNFYLRKSRLVKKISDSGAPHLDFFLNKLGK